jgi:hypothetical protein
MQSLSRKPEKNRLYFDAIYMSVQLIEFAYEIGELGMDFEIAQEFQREPATPGFDALYALVVIGDYLEKVLLNIHAAHRAADPLQPIDQVGELGLRANLAQMLDGARGAPLFQSRDPFFIESHARTMAAAPPSFTDCSKRYGVAPYACHIMSAPDDV